jgi:hypothetical protein
MSMQLLMLYHLARLQGLVSMLLSALLHPVETSKMSMTIGTTSKA